MGLSLVCDDHHLTIDGTKCAVTVHEKSLLFALVPGSLLLLHDPLLLWWFNILGCFRHDRQTAPQLCSPPACRPPPS